MKVRRLPKTVWGIEEYDLNFYGYGDVDIFIDETNKIGERIICIFRKKDLLKYDDKSCFETTLAILCNNCGVESGIKELIGLNAGQIIPVTFNGDFNPTVPLNWVTSRFWTL